MGEYSEGIQVFYLKFNVYDIVVYFNFVKIREYCIKEYVLCDVFFVYQSCIMFFGI